jgi:hypothetical protein
VFKEDPETGKKKKIPSMNDKCAGGTGAVIDKINAKLKIPAAELCNMGYVGLKLHPVAGKCGVFAETDINGLQKSGVPADELMASLFESIIQQSIAVAGDTVPPMLISLVTLWLVQLPLAYFLPRITNLDVLGVRWAMVMSTVVGAVAYAVYFQTGRWKHKRV